MAPRPSTSYQPLEEAVGSGTCLVTKRWATKKQVRKAAYLLLNRFLKYCSFAPCDVGIALIERGLASKPEPENILVTPSDAFTNHDRWQRPFL